MQNVTCSIKNCGYCSVNGICLNRLVHINQQGVCNWLTKQGWNQQIEENFKSIYNPWRAPVQTPAQISNKQNQDQNKSGKDRPPREEQN